MQMFYLNAPTGKCSSSEKIGGTGGIRLNLILARLIRLLPCDAETPIIVIDDGYAERVHDRGGNVNIRRFERANHLNLHIVFGVRRDEEE